MGILDPHPASLVQVQNAQSAAAAAALAAATSAANAAATAAALAALPVQGTLDGGNAASTYLIDIDAGSAA